MLVGSAAAGGACITAASLPLTAETTQQNSYKDEGQKTRNEMTLDRSTHYAVRIKLFNSKLNTKQYHKKKQKRGNPNELVKCSPNDTNEVGRTEEIRFDLEQVNPDFEITLMGKSEKNSLFLSSNCVFYTPPQGETSQGVR